MRKEPRPKYVMCVKGDFDLLEWKVYRTQPDPEAAEADLIRVVDESGEDYLYPASCFVPVTVPPSVAKLIKRGRVAVAKNPPARRRRG